MNDAAKFTAMHDKLDTPLEGIIAAIDNGGSATSPEGTDYHFTPSLFAGLAAAKVLLAQAQYTEMGDEREGGWDLFRSRLKFAVEALTDAPDAGAVTQFGVWDGMHFAAVTAGLIDGEGASSMGRALVEGVHEAAARREQAPDA